MNNAELMLKALPEFGTRLETVRADQWKNPTPDEDWTVRDLVKHVVYEVLWAPPLLAGQTTAEVGDRFEGDILKDDPVTTWRRAVGQLKAALTDIDLAKTVHLSYGNVPAEEYLGQLFNDVLIHSWDLAKGVGADDKLNEQLVEADYANIKSQAGQLASSGLFGQPVPVADDVDLQTKLLALLGRQA